jgi:hypothetical protein
MMMMMIIIIIVIIIVLVVGKTEHTRSLVTSATRIQDIHVWNAGLNTAFQTENCGFFFLLVVRMDAWTFFDFIRIISFPSTFSSPFIFIPIIQSMLWKGLEKKSTLVVGLVRGFNELK